MLLLPACGTPRVVADSGCSWVKPIVVSEEQVEIFAANLRVMRPLADQINAQNTTRTEKCR